MKKKIKTTWRVFSAKRRVSISSLASAGKFSNYLEYLKYCETYTVLPASPEEFALEVPDREAAHVVEEKSEITQSVSVSETFLTASTPASPTVEPGLLEATVWLAGVKDEPETARIEEKKLFKKSKKKDTQQD